MDQRRFGGLLLAVLVVASTLDDVVDGQRTINKCCAKNERLYWAGDTGQYECETVPQGTVPGERYNVDGVDEEGMKTNVTEDAGESVTVSFGGDFDEVQFGNFLARLKSLSNVSLGEDDLVMGVFPSCPKEETDWLYASTITLRMTPNAVTLRETLREVYEFPAQDWCVDMDDIGDLVAFVCPCNSADPPCVRQCCRQGEALNKNLKCVNSTLENWTPTEEDPGVRYYLLEEKFPSCSLTTAEKFPVGQLKLQADGSMKGVDAVGRNLVFGPGQFCVDSTNATNTSDPIGDQMVVFCIITDDLSDVVTIFKGVVTLLGAVALLVTVVLTIYVPEMRQNIHGKMALCHNVSLLFAFICIGITQVSANKMSSITCKLLSFVMQYTLLAAFFWLNVMCVEVSWVFSALRPVKKVMGGKKFRWYSLYAWGTTSLITIITMLVEFVPGAKLKPRFGEANCFFHGDSMIPQLLFLFGPMGILLAINVGLFVYTATKIITHRRQTSILNDSNTINRNNQNLILYIKLFTLMGVTWIFEIVSWAVGGKNYYWLAIDCVNLLRGIFIFFIFCCKRSVLEPLRARLGCLRARDSAQVSAGTKSPVASLAFNKMLETIDASIAAKRTSDLR